MTSLLITTGYKAFGIGILDGKDVMSLTYLFANCPLLVSYMEVYRTILRNSLSLVWV